jgi:UDP-N-acetylenolpyruvoylglucosamine reductase
MTVMELRENIIKKVAEDFNISLEQAKDLINSSFEIGEPE